MPIKAYPTLSWKLVMLLEFCSDFISSKKNHSQVHITNQVSSKTLNILRDLSYMIVLYIINKVTLPYMV